MRPPSAALLVIEVAVSSLHYDREVKASLYARAGVVEYWIVDLEGEALERFSQPGTGGYGRVERLSGDAEVAPETLGRPTVVLSELLAFALGR